MVISNPKLKLTNEEFTAIAAMINKVWQLQQR